MKNNNITSILMAAVSVLIAFLAVSCSDVLDKQPTTSISDATFWKSESDASLALVGCYEFPHGWNHADFAHPQGLMYLDLAGGNGVEKENFTTLGMASSNTVATSDLVYGYWSNAYAQIAAYNTFLDNIGKCPMDDSKKAIWTAEVKCLRAYYLFNLAFYWGNVPMPLTTQTVSQANSISQTPQATVYSQVETDLKSALSVLPDKRTSSEYGRVTTGFVRVLLSRLYLAQQKWTDAATVLKAIVDSNIYKLDRTLGYEKLFQIGGETSSEMIFVIQYLKDQFTTSRYIYLFPECNGGWHQFAPYNELVKDYFCTDGKPISTSSVYSENDPYANRDPRLYSSIFLPPLGSYAGTKFNNVTYNCYKGAGTSDYYSKFPLFNGYCPKKGCDASATDLYSTYTYTPLMRYAEVLLSYIEAVNESGYSNVTQALLDQTINDVRSRVNLPAITLADVSSQTTLRAAIRQERRVELAFEGLRYYDVLRWGTAATELNHTFTGVKLSDDPTAANYRGSGSTASPVDANKYYQFETRTWDSHNRYFPIPQHDLNINPNLVQNSGYK
ncbi:RagB/SusD family nutrient uptake outer membrane protein [Paludibacter jiangxiensis]|uniref:Starch-binding associating with outer membrane n=1 Tax=Paludibacter jiangxiensis TaxID=681398 RepID=A0A161LI59_9BACT|nr:RagB/SusD family nutrient uptake outer membrane protein [Paludibacter jiangxiensis]GAT62006.1 starch-binding associating with outer membrane [Paludibacter jiangxiensis]